MSASDRPPDGGASIRARGWGWRHPGRRAWAIRDVDLTVEAGERVLILGASGAGKSTLLRGLAGLLDPTVGDQVGSLEVAGAEPAALASAGRLGYLQQDPQAQLVMARAGDDVAFGLENVATPTEEIWPAVDRALASVGFRYGRQRATAALSGGEQQRLALAGVLALRPRLLLLDEPTANLDPAGAAAVRSALGTVRAATGATMLLVEHRITESLPLVDRIVVLSAGGGVRLDGPAEDVVRRNPDLFEPAARRSPNRLVTRSSASAALLAAADVRVSGSGGAPILDGVDFTANAAEITAITGPNGAGKSTLARILGGLRAPDSGTVTATAALAGGERRPPWRWRAATLAGRIGTVFQNPEHQFLTGRVRTELTRAARGRGRDAAERVDELLIRLRLDRLAEANPFTLSGGEQRRLSVATALVAAPALVVLDEPTFGQDPTTWAELVDLLAELRDTGVGVVTVTHDEAFVSTLADRIVRLANGRVSSVGQLGDDETDVPNSEFSETAAIPDARISPAWSGRAEAVKR